MNTPTGLWHKTRQNESEKKGENVQDEKRFEMPVQEHHRPQGCISNTVLCGHSYVPVWTLRYRYALQDLFVKVGIGLRGPSNYLPLFA